MFFTFLFLNIEIATFKVAFGFLAIIFGLFYLFSFPLQLEEIHIEEMEYSTEVSRTGYRWFMYLTILVQIQVMVAPWLHYFGIINLND